MARRTDLAKMGDTLLFLYLIDDASAQGWIGATKLQKLVFLSELGMIQQNLVGFNYSFVKLTHGPYSGQVHQDHLKNLGIKILSENQGIQLIDYGKNLVDNFREVFEANEEIVGVIQDVNQEFAPMQTDDILDHVYALPHPIRKTYTIEETPLNQTLLAIPSKTFKKKAEAVFELSEDWMATLEIYLNPDFYYSLKKAQEEAKHQKPLSHEEVFGRV